MDLVEQILAKPDLISANTKRLAEEARQRVETYASTLIEPPVRWSIMMMVNEDVLMFSWEKLSIFWIAKNSSDVLNKHDD